MDVLYNLFPFICYTHARSSYHLPCNLKYRWYFLWEHNFVHEWDIISWHSCMRQCHSLLCDADFWNVCMKMTAMLFFQNCEVIQNFCFKIWYKYIRINSKILFHILFLDLDLIADQNVTFCASGERPDRGKRWIFFCLRDLLYELWLLNEQDARAATVLYRGVSKYLYCMLVAGELRFVVFTSCHVVIYCKLFLTFY